MGASIDDLGELEQVLTTHRAHRSFAPGLRVQEHAATNQAVPILDHRGVDAEKLIGRLVGMRPRSRGLIAPIADDVRSIEPTLDGPRRQPGRYPSSRALNEHRGRPRRRGSSRADRRSGPVPVPLWAATNSASRRQWETPAIGTRTWSFRNAAASLLGVGRLDGLPEPFSRASRALLREGTESLGVRCRQRVGIIEQIEKRDLAGQSDPRQYRIVAEGQTGFGVDVLQ